MPTPSAGTRQTKRPIRSTRKLRGVPDTPVANEVRTASAARYGLFPWCNITIVCGSSSSLWYSSRLFGKHASVFEDLIGGTSRWEKKLAQWRVVNREAWYYVTSAPPYCCREDNPSCLLRSILFLPIPYPRIYTRRRSLHQ